MRKFTGAVALVMLCAALSGCGEKLYNGTDGLIEKAREELPLSDAATTEIKYGGMIITSDNALAWYISGDEYQAHYYLPMEIELKDSERCAFVRSYKPMTGDAKDIAYVKWNDGYVFIINNPDCAVLRITGGNGDRYESIDSSRLPYVYYYPALNAEYGFLDSDGNELGAGSSEAQDGVE